MLSRTGPFSEGGKCKHPSEKFTLLRYCGPRVPKSTGAQESRCAFGEGACFACTGIATECVCFCASRGRRCYRHSESPRELEPRQFAVRGSDARVTARSDPDKPSEKFQAPGCWAQFSGEVLGKMAECRRPALAVERRSQTGRDAAHCHISVS